MARIPPEFAGAYAEYERELTVRKTRLGCVLGAIFVPLFAWLDHYMYPEHVRSFLIARLLCSAAMIALYPVIGTKPGRKFFRAQGVVILFMPTAAISWMVYATEGAASPYYAGLILVMMFLAVLLDWTFWQSVASVTLVWTLYLLACVFSPFRAEVGILVNNLFFLVATGIVIIISAQFHSDIRQREFVSRCEQEKANRELAEQKAALERANLEIKAAEAQLVQSEKMSSLGRFSAGLMHDILNPLNYTRTGAFTLRKKTRQLPPELRTEIDAILTDMEDGLKRVDNIVSDLRTFTHPGGQARELTNLADVLNISLRFVSAELKDKNIAVNLDVPPGQTAWISRNHLILVLVNLLENAIDALELKPFAGDDRPTVTIASRVENGRSLISIRDNGPGIAPEHLAKIFDPFYTTKDVGKGTGLGLSICFGIVRGCGGSISAVSEPGKFCEFILDLPSTFVSETDATTPLQHADQPIRL